MKLQPVLAVTFLTTLKHLGYSTVKKKMSSSAYGASFAGSGFDFVGFLKQPQTVLRCLSWVSDDTDTLASGLASCQ